MNSASIAVIALACVLIGLVFAMVGVFCVVLFMQMRKLTAAVEVMTELQRAVADDRQMAELIPVLKSLARCLPSVVQQAEGMVGALRVFNKLIFDSNKLRNTQQANARPAFGATPSAAAGAGAEAETFAPEGSSQVSHFDENTSGKIEEVEELEKQGIDITGKNVPVPIPETIEYSDI